MAVTYDNAVTSGDLSLLGAGVTTASWTHVTSGTNRYIVVGLAGWDASSILTPTVKYAGVTLTPLGGMNAAGTSQVYLWGLVNPTIGSNLVELSNIPEDYTQLAGGSVSFAGATQSGTVVSDITGSVTIPINANDLGVCVTYDWDNATPFPDVTPVANVTDRVVNNITVAGGTFNIHMGTRPGPGSVSIGYTSNGDSVIAAVPILASIPFVPFGTLLGSLTGSGSSVVNPSNANGSVVVSVGDLVWAVFAQQTNLTTSGVTDNLGNTYTAKNAGTDVGTVTGRAFYSRVTVAGTLTQVRFAATASSNDYACVASVFKGPFITSPIDTNPANVEDVVTPYTCPATGTRAQIIEMVLCASCRSGANAFTATAPNLKGGEILQTNVSATIGYQVTTSTATISPAFTGTTPTDNFLCTASFRKENESGSALLLSYSNLSASASINYFAQTYNIAASSIAGSVLTASSKLIVSSYSNRLAPLINLTVGARITASVNASFPCSSLLATTAILKLPLKSFLNGSGLLVGSIFVGVPGSAYTTCFSNLAASVIAIVSANTYLNSSGGLLVSTISNKSAPAILVGSALLTSNIIVKADASAFFSGSIASVQNINLIGLINAVLPGSSSLKSIVAISVPGEAVLVNESSLTGSSFVSSFGSTKLTAASNLTVSTTVRYAGHTLKHAATFTILDRNAGLTLSGSGSIITNGGNATAHIARANQGKNTGKWYFEVALSGVTTDAAGNIAIFGLQDGTTAITDGIYVGDPSSTLGFGLGSSTDTGSVIATGGTAMFQPSDGLFNSGRYRIAADLDNKKVWIGDSIGNWIGGGDPEIGNAPTITWSIATPMLFPACSATASIANVFTFYLGPDSNYSYRTPSGYNTGWFQTEANDEFTVSLLHCDGSNGGTTFTDSNYGGTAKTWTASVAVTSTAQKYFGSTAYYGTGVNSYISTPVHANWNPAGDFTVDLWVYPTTVNSSRAVFSSGANAGVFVAPLFIYQTNTAFVFYASSNGTAWDIASAKSLGSVAINSWQHLEVSRRGSGWSCFNNGILTSSWTSTGVLMAPVNPIAVGIRYGFNDSFIGYVDEFRFSNGIARHSWTNFTPPSHPYVDTDLLVGATARSSITLEVDHQVTGNASARLSGASSLMMSTINTTEASAFLIGDSSIQISTTVYSTPSVLFSVNGTLSIEYSRIGSNVEVARHYATLTPLDRNPGLTLSGFPVTIATNGGNSSQHMLRANQGKNTGRWYFEFSVSGIDTTATCNTTIVGFHVGGSSIGDGYYVTDGGALGFGIGDSTDEGAVYAVGCSTPPVESFSGLVNGGRYRIAVNFDNKKAWFSDHTGAWIGGGDPGIGSIPTFSWSVTTPMIFPACSANGAVANVIQFYFRPNLSYAVPAGFNEGWYQEEYLNDNFTTSMLHCDGDNNGTVFIDSNYGGSAKTWTAVGTAVTSTTQSKFGTASYYNSGASACYISTPDHADWNATGDFTLDLWVYPTTIDSSRAIFSNGSNAVVFVSPLFVYQTNTAFVFYASSTGSSWDIASAKSLGTVARNTWQHLEVSRRGSGWSCFNNGVLTSSWTSTGVLMAPASETTVGVRNGYNDYFIGYIDEVRFTKGIARHSYTNFAVPVSPYTINNAASVLLTDTSDLTISTSVNTTGSAYTYSDSLLTSYALVTTSGSALFTGSDARLSVTATLRAISSAFFIASGYLTSNGSIVEVIGSSFFTGSGALKCDVTGAGGIWYTLIGPDVLVGGFAGSGWYDFTVRDRIDKGGYNVEVPSVGTRIRITYRSPATAATCIGKSYVGYSPATGDAYDFESTPVQVLFGGQPDVIVPVNTTVLSDDIDFPFDKTKSLIVSAYFNAASDIAYRPSMARYTSSWISGDDAATVDTTGYSSASIQAILVDGIDVIHITEAIGTTGSVPFIGRGTLTTKFYVNAAGSAFFSGDSSINIINYVLVSTSSDLSGVCTLTGDSTVCIPISILLNGESTLELVTYINTTGSTLFSGNSILSIPEISAVVASLTLFSAGSSFIPIISISTTGSAFFNGQSYLTPYVSARALISATLQNNGSLSCDSVVGLPSSSLLTGSSSLASTVIVLVSGRVGFVDDVSLKVDAFTITTGSALLENESILLSSASVVVIALSHLYGSSLLVSAGFIRTTGSSLFNGQSFSDQKASILTPATALLETISSLVVGTTSAVSARALLIGSSVSLISTIAWVKTTALLISEGLLSASSVRITTAETKLLGSCVLYVRAEQTSTTAVTIAGIGDLSVDITLKGLIPVATPKLIIVSTVSSSIALREVIFAGFVSASNLSANVFNRVAAPITICNVTSLLAGRVSSLSSASAVFTGSSYLSASALLTAESASLATLSGSSSLNSSTNLRLSVSAALNIGSLLSTNMFMPTVWTGSAELLNYSNLISSVARNTPVYSRFVGSSNTTMYGNTVQVINTLLSGDSVLSTADIIHQRSIYSRLSVDSDLQAYSSQWLMAISSLNSDSSYLVSLTSLGNISAVFNPRTDLFTDVSLIPKQAATFNGAGKLTVRTLISRVDNITVEEPGRPDNVIKFVGRPQSTKVFGQSGTTKILGVGSMVIRITN